MSDSKQHKCPHCPKSYAYASGLRKHRAKRKCGPILSFSAGAKMEIQRLSLLLKERTKELKKANKELAKKDEKIEWLEQALVDSTKVKSDNVYINNTVDSININSTNHVKQLLIEHSTAPDLTKIEDASLIFDDINSDTMIKDIIYDHRKKILHQTIGNGIVKLYSKPDPREQSVWNTDTSRLNYLIKKAVSKTKSQWMMDKRGCNITDYVIKPILAHLKDRLLEFKIPKRTERYLKLHLDILELVRQINDNVLEPKINKFIAPRLHFSNSSGKLLIQNSSMEVIEDVTDT